MEQQTLFGELLHNRRDFINRSLTEGIAGQEIFTLLVTSIGFLAFYGFIIGLVHSLLQAAVSAVKLPCLFLITSAICFPTLYFFLSMFGIRQSVKQIFSFLLICLFIMSMVLAVFAPISIFFLITSYSYPFFKLLNVCIFSIAGIIGLHFFEKYIQTTMQNIGEEINHRRARIFLKLWLVLFAFIGCQLSYSLSPFFGDPTQPFMLFTKGGSNFYIDVIHSIANI